MPALPHFQREVILSTFARDALFGLPAGGLSYLPASNASSIVIRAPAPAMPGSRYDGHISPTKALYAHNCFNEQRGKFVLYTFEYLQGRLRSVALHNHQ